MRSLALLTLALIGASLLCMHTVHGSVTAKAPSTLNGPPAAASASSAAAAGAAAAATAKQQPTTAAPSKNKHKKVKPAPLVTPKNPKYGPNWGNSSVEHPIDFNNPHVIAFFAHIENTLALRNYSRPTSAYLRSPNGVEGVDISSWCGENTWSCLLQNGKQYGIVREWEEICAVDPNGVHSVANAWASKVAHVDIYMYPSWGCGVSAAAQVDQTINAMGGIPFGTLWFDIEQDGAGGHAADHAWLQQAVGRAVARLGQSRVGIYSSENGWSVAIGPYSDFNFLPIWYAHYDNNPSFSDWSGFGGWNSPAMKQYAGSNTICGEGVDLNWYP